MSNPNTIIIICVVSALITIFLMYLLFRSEKSSRPPVGFVPAAAAAIPQNAQEELSSEDESIVIINQPDLVEISKNWEPLEVVEKVGLFEIYVPTADICKWRMKTPAGDVIMMSNADYATDITCKNGVHSAVRSIKTSVENSAFTVGVSNQHEYSFVLKAGNGKIIGTGQMYESEEAVDKTIETIKKLVAIHQ